MKKYQLKKIGIKSVAKLYLAFGLIFGLFMGGLTLLGIVFASPQGAVVMPFMIFFMICLYALMGAGIAALVTWLYNLAAERIGGIEIYLTEVEYLAPGPTHTQEDPKLT